MKTVLRAIVINFLTLLLIAVATKTVSFSNNYMVLFWAAFFLSVLNLLVKPILNILLTPINFLTLGAFRWIINMIILFLVTIFVPQFKINSFYFGGLAYNGFSLPSMSLTSFWAFFLVSFLIELVQGAVGWLLK